MPPDPLTGCAATHRPLAPPIFLKVLFWPPLSILLNETLLVYLQKTLLYLWSKLLTSSLHTLRNSLWKPILDKADIFISLVALISLEVGKMA